MYWVRRSAAGSAELTGRTDSNELNQAVDAIRDFVLRVDNINDSNQIIYQPRGMWNNDEQSSRPLLRSCSPLQPTMTVSC